MSRSLLLFLAVAMTLGGCASQERKTAPAPPPPETSMPEPEPPDLFPPPLPKPPPPKPPVAKAAPKPESNPDELIGLDQDAVSKLLGNPADNRSEAGAKVLTYRGRDCVLDVIFFRDVKTGVDRVLSFDLQPIANRRPQPCYAEMRREK